METLLKEEFTAHYGLTVSTINNITQHVNFALIEIEDDEDRETQITDYPNSGTAIYQNPNRKEIAVINYDKFITSLDVVFQNGRKRCDLIVYTETNTDYFLLNELKDANPRIGRRKAKKQLVQSLMDLMAVGSIERFIRKFGVKRCCFFNKRVIYPQFINAGTVFNRVNTIVPQGLQLHNANIEGLGFELFEYTGGQYFEIQ